MGLIFTGFYMRHLLLTITLFSLHTMAMAKVKTNESYLLLSPTKETLRFLKSNPEIAFDHATRSTIEVYGPQGLAQYLNDLSVEFIAYESFHHHKSLKNYPTPDEINQKILSLHRQNPEITQLEQIGTSVQGRPIYAIKISDNPLQDELEPEVKYIANMHGDEIVGRELMVLLIEDLTTRYKSGDEKVINLVNNTEIFIVASMNPDGALNRRRGNADWVDLNRDFPDHTTRDDQNTPHGREIETKSIMEWQTKRNFSLSANFHGGAEVVNYPWDTTGEQHPLHAHVLAISKEYAQQVPGMKNSIEFPGGVVNGYDWYEVNGGMQDWSYYWHNDLQVTIELSNSKWPNYSEVSRYWNENKNALVDFLSKVHQGIGLRTSSNEKFVSINKDGQHIGVFPVRHNEFHKVLPSGYYKLSILDENKKVLKKIKQRVEKSTQIKSYINL